jgi:NADH:ubiquinone oxidoreductase subunit 4 (subunit M)
MFQRVAFGTVSDFLRGLGDHVTDMSRAEFATLAPLAALIVLFGLFPSLILDFLHGPVQTFLAAAGAAVGG